MILVLVLSATIGIDADAEAKAAIAIVQASGKIKAVQECRCGGSQGPSCDCKACVCDLAYDAAASLAAKTGKPLVVFCGQPSRAVPGCVTCREDKMPGAIGKEVRVYLPDGKGWIGDGRRLVDADATNADIVALVRSRTEVGQLAVPFVELSGRVDADHDGWLPVREQERLKQIWPKNVEFPVGMRFYQPTKYSQRIAVTNERESLAWYNLGQHDVWSNAPTSFNPNTTDERWIAPGGLVGVAGWSHAPAAFLPASPRKWEAKIPIANGGLITGNQWSYPDGTVFADMLMKDGECFELRIREKKDGVWDSYVSAKFPESRPIGYHGAGRKCAECHDKAGTSEQYGITVRGCDTVFSLNPLMEHGDK